MVLRTHYLYLKQFIGSPKTMGTIVPSSFWLCQSMVEYIDPEQDVQIAELGAGTGVLTREILKRMSGKSTLDSYEIEPVLAAELKKIHDTRLTAYQTSAEYFNHSYHLIFSGIPFLSLDRRTGVRILQNVRERLMDKTGVFILFQYTRRYEKVLSRYFEIERKFVLLNVPCAWVYCCRIKSASPEMRRQ